MPSPIIIIPARMGSVRLPGKPLALIEGRPMVLWVRDRAVAAGLGPVVVACAEAEIADVVSRDGGQAVLTDPALPSGTDRVHAACMLVDPQGAHDVVINLQGDLPTFEGADIARVMDPLAAGYDIATLVAPITSADEAASLSVVKAACDFSRDETVACAPYFSRNPIPSGDGPLWHHVGIYAFRRDALSRFVSLPESGLERRERLEQLRAIEAGMRIGASRIAVAPFGVDTPDDLERARRALAGRPQA
jgi:3-deoxy-manno-octulosonate cytidylyltransferase (CMP-KDO synthetase)